VIKLVAALIALSIIVFLMIKIGGKKKWIYLKFKSKI
jgi:hypothetical protein